MKMKASPKQHGGLTSVMESSCSNQRMSRRRKWGGVASHLPFTWWQFATSLWQPWLQMYAAPYSSSASPPPPPITMPRGGKNCFWSSTHENKQHTLLPPPPLPRPNYNAKKKIAYEYTHMKTNNMVFLPFFLFFHFQRDLKLNSNVIN